MMTSLNDAVSHQGTMWPKNTKKCQNNHLFLSKKPRKCAKKPITNGQFRLRENKIRQTISGAVCIESIELNLILMPLNFT